jgi:hypothetical protein
MISPGRKPSKISRRLSMGPRAAGDHMTRFMNRHARSFAQVSVVAFCAWVLAGIIDGAAPREIFGIPLLLTAWAGAFVLIDRWVMNRHD